MAVLLQVVVTLAAVAVTPQENLKGRPLITTTSKIGKQGFWALLADYNVSRFAADMLPWVVSAALLFVFGKM